MTRKLRIEHLIREKLSPVFLQVENESHMHHVPEGSESHFKLILASDVFQGKKLLERHRLVNNILAEELQQGLHALSLHLYSPEEWQAREQQVQPSPACRDGFRHRKQ